MRATLEQKAATQLGPLGAFLSRTDCDHLSLNRAPVGLPRALLRTPVSGLRVHLPGVTGDPRRVCCFLDLEAPQPPSLSWLSAL